MLTSDFDFDLPTSLIATHPMEPRDASRLLHVRADGLSDKKVWELPSLLREGDLMVFNNTKVLPARLYGKRGEASVEVTLHQELYSGVWTAFAKPAKKLQLGERFMVTHDFYAEVEDKQEGGQVTLRFNVQGPTFQQYLMEFGIIPLPPYIAKLRKPDDTDKDTYQTVYAEKEGAVAAPTAGLHFTDKLLNELNNKGIKKAFSTLHVGAGTFLPVKVDDVANHKMHAEYYELDEATAEQINATRKNGGRIIAVGTTALRTLETLTDENNITHAGSGTTDIFITPGYQFKGVDVLFTNFHTPRSTLMMLVSAFMGFETMHAAYQHAINAEYRFYSYGDACLLERKI